MFTWVEINTSAIRHNIERFRDLVGPDVLIMPVVKANAYGHGFLEIAKICEKETQVNRICVVNSDEALRLIDNNITKPILILSFYDLEDKILEKLIKSDVIFSVYRFDQAEKLNIVGEKLNKKVKIHIKVDTGASRVGILAEEALEFVKQIKEFINLELEGLWSHFASSEDDEEYTLKQKERMDGVISSLEENNINIPIKHMDASAASVLYKDSNYSAIRLGISLYGLHPSNKTENKIELKPALSWFTKIIQVKTVPAGTKISYGCTYETDRQTKIAVLPVGYWDGYDRGMSNKAEVLVRGQKCAVLGRICMNMCVIDVTDVKGVETGDKVVLIGKEEGSKITAEDLAGWAGTINYEIVDRINPLIKRIYK